MFKKIVLILAIFAIAFLAGWTANSLYRQPKTSNNPISQIKPRPLEKYTIDNLSKLNAEGGYSAQTSNLKTEEILKEDKDFTSYLFSFKADNKRVTGLINIPKGNGPFPAIVMFRGYVDQKQYKTGDGTRKAGEFFAKNGFITVAPDFLGFGGSDPEGENIFESRFQTYTTSFILLKSLASIEGWDGKNIFIWGHSNGGQIALTVLEITGATYPTVLWAPVSKPFPYSILYYTDESDDRGKLIRHELSKFEEDYDVELFSLTNYLDRIKAPMQINQGTADDAVPVKWTNDLVKTLKDKEVEVKYLKYPESDHYLNPAWNTVVAKNLEFFKENLTR